MSVARIHTPAKHHSSTSRRPTYRTRHMVLPVLALALLLSAAATGTAFAAGGPPPNDDIANAQAVQTLDIGADGTVTFVLPTDGLTSGPHTLLVRYDGDTGHGFSNSSTLDLSIV